MDMKEDYKNINPCCSDLKTHLFLIEDSKCLETGDKIDKVIHYSSKFNEYGIIMNDETSYIMINYCPWCGAKLPNSLRDQWFDELFKLGYKSPMTDLNYPEKFKSASWWRLIIDKQKE